METTFEQHVFSSFEILGIDPTVNITNVQKAFRKKASKIHPDRFKTQEEKQNAHENFIKLAAARDILIESLSQPDFVNWLSEEMEGYKSTTSFEDKKYSTSKNNKKTSESMNKDKDSIKKEYEEEWNKFVKNGISYTDFFRGSSNIFTTMFTILFSGAILGIIIAVMVSIFLGIIVGAIALGLLTALLEIAIPVIGWIALAATVGYALHAIGEIADRGIYFIQRYIGAFCLKLVIRTGYPVVGLWVSFIITDIIFVIALSGMYKNDEIVLFFKVLATFLFLSSNLGFYIIYVHIKDKLFEINNLFKELHSIIKERKRKKTMEELEASLKSKAIFLLN